MVFCLFKLFGADGGSTLAGCESLAWAGTGGTARGGTEGNAGCCLSENKRKTKSYIRQLSHLITAFKLLIQAFVREYVSAFSSSLPLMAVNGQVASWSAWPSWWQVASRVAWPSAWPSGSACPLRPVSSKWLCFQISLHVCFPWYVLTVPGARGQSILSHVKHIILRVWDSRSMFRVQWYRNSRTVRIEGDKDLESLSFSSGYGQAESKKENFIGPKSLGF